MLIFFLTVSIHSQISKQIAYMNKLGFNHQMYRLKIWRLQGMLEGFFFFIVDIKENREKGILQIQVMEEK